MTTPSSSVTHARVRRDAVCVTVLQRHLLVFWSAYRLSQHQRPEHAGKERQRGGGHRGGLGDGGVGDGRAAVPGGKIRPAASSGVLQVGKHPEISLFNSKESLETEGNV